MSKFLSEKYASLEAYVPGEQPQDMQYIKLNTNESPYPPSPKVAERIHEQEIKKLGLYPDPTGIALRRKIAGLYGVSEDNVFLSNGSDEILNFAFMAFCDQCHPVVFPSISYGFYKVFADLYALPYEEIPLNDDFTINCQDYFGIHKNIVIANPNAPTGLAISLADVEEMLKTNPDHVVLIDEAYIDFGGESAYPLIQKYDNLLVAQTFSKSRSMAGGRLGFALGSRGLIEDLDKMKYSTNPYNVNRLTLAAGEASIEDNDYTMQNCREIMKTRAYVTEKLREMGAVLNDSKTNFVFVKLPGIDGQEAYEKLKAMGILVRHFEKDRIADYLRVTIGTREEMDVFLNGVKSILTA